MGIDPSLTSTGVVVIDGQCHLLDSLSITSGPEKTWRGGITRILGLSVELLGFLWKVGRPVVIGLEGYSYASRYQAHQLGELGFVYRRVLFGFDTFIVAPRMLKRFTTNKGNASKENVARAIKEQFNLEFADYNLSDACAIALFVRALSGGGKEYFNENQMKVIEDYREKSKMGRP